ncbi:MAG TPA: fused MFS/spermidine synthase [Bacteroidia bacterium]|jgi:spermidine synthase|nr:fused MFS/spermidine synthase [Bacteroidia bacterium]
MKKIFSHILPFSLKKYKSKFSGQLEINYNAGKKVLDTSNSNYSYGALQKILHRGLEEIKFNNDIKNILVLGLGGGSIIETIREDFKSKAFIELVDIDDVVITIAKEEFEIERFKNINIICDDAADYIKKTNKTFDLIIVDIFIIATIPEIFTETEFLTNLVNRLDPSGKIIYNTMRSTMPKETLNRIEKVFYEQDLKIKVLEKVEGSNDLIIAEK